MIQKKDKKISPEKTSNKKNDVDDLEQFIQKKKNQNLALKKVMAKLKYTSKSSN